MSEADTGCSLCMLVGAGVSFRYNPYQEKGTHSLRMSTVLYIHHTAAETDKQSKPNQPILSHIQTFT